MKPFGVLVFVSLALTPLIWAKGPDRTSTQVRVTYTDLNRMLRSECVFCHGWDKEARKSGYPMVTYQSLMDGAFRDGEFRKVIIPGDAEHSPFVEYIEGKRRPRMPYERDPLREEEITQIRAWITQGALGGVEAEVEHEIAMTGVPITNEREFFWLSCRAPKDEQNLALRVKVMDEASARVVAYEWPGDDNRGRDLNGRWSQWRIEIPHGSMKLPGTVKVVLFVAPFMAGRTADDTLSGVIFVLDNRQTSESELLKQKDFRSLPGPENPPHQRVLFSYVLRSRSDVELLVCPEQKTQPIFLRTDKDVPATNMVTILWDLPKDGSVKNGWYTGRLKCDSRVQSEFQPDLAILFKLQTDIKP